MKNLKDYLKKEGSKKASTQKEETQDCRTIISTNVKYIIINYKLKKKVEPITKKKTRRKTHTKLLDLKCINIFTTTTTAA